MPRSSFHGVIMQQAPVTQPVESVDMSVIGVIGTAPYADQTLWPLNKPILVSGSDQTLIGALTKNAPSNSQDIGSLMPAFSSMLDECSPTIIAIRVDGQNSYDSKDIPNVVGGVDKNGNYSGVHAFLSAENETGFRPRLLCAPGYTQLQGAPIQQTDKDGKPKTITSQTTGYPVLSELQGIANRLGGVIFADGPNTNATDAIKMAQVGDARTMVIDPWIIKTINGVEQIVPASSKFAARQALADQQQGFWRSVSNLELHGVEALARPIDFVDGDASSQANLLNQNNVSTIIRRGGVGYVSWGDRATDGSFLCVQRTVDEINRALQLSTIQFVDMGITKQFFTEVCSEVNSYLRKLENQGAITGGHCWADPEKNDAAAIKAGQAYFDFDLGATYPAEQITFTSCINDGYISNIFQGSNA